MWLMWFLVGAVMTLALLLSIYQIPPVKYRLEWRLDKAEGVVRGWLYPGDTLPTPARAQRPLALPTHFPTASPVPTGMDIADPPTPSPTSTPLPRSVHLQAPEWEKQDWNNCGPATLALGLRFHGWEGDQFDISDLLKPDRGDKNVNIEELVYFVRTRAGWLTADFRVGGDLESIKRFVAAGIPVIVEKGFTLDERDGGGGWAGHYLLITGYNDGEGTFTVQDTNPSTGGVDRQISFEALDREWRAFNRVYLYIYLPHDEAKVQELLGPDADPEMNRQRALEAARDEIESGPEDAYAWFNLGSNLVYFGRYGQAADAFDNALSLGLPWRFTRYQFGPYFAYFNQGRYQDLIDLADATLYRTYKAEESLLWRGWAYYQMGLVGSAEDDFLRALAINPYYLDAQYALTFIRDGG
jgi:hypothetical protein